MSLLLKKILYFGLLWGGCLAVLSPIVIAMTGRDESATHNSGISYPLFAVGLVMIISAIVFACKTFRCTACNNHYIIFQGGKNGTYAGGLTGMVRILRLRKCPTCGEDL